MHSYLQDLFRNVFVTPLPCQIENKLLYSQIAYFFFYSINIGLKRVGTYFTLFHDDIVRMRLSQKRYKIILTQKHLHNFT